MAQSQTAAQLLNGKPTSDQVKAAFQMVAAVAEAIREAGEIPSGTLYAVLCSKVDMAGYESIIRTLKNADLVSESAHMLKWIGPRISA